MLWPFVRSSATTWRISSIVSTSCILEAMLCIRVGAVSDVARPPTNRGSDFTRHLGIALQELWLERVVETQQIREHQDLAITLRAGADPDRRYPNRSSYALGNRSWDQLQYDGERARLLEPFCFGDESLGVYSFAPLHSRSTDRIHGLRRKANVRHHWNPGPHQRVDGFEHLRIAALDLHRAHARFLNGAPAVQHRALDARLIRKKRHVDNYQRAFYPAAHRRCVVEHLLQGDRQCRWIPHDRRAD